MSCSTPCEFDEKLEFYPPKLWGLDYQFHVYNKMYVQDILEMKEYPHFTGAFCYKNHPIYKVDVIGVVVKKVENSKCFIYAVDDGTGVILCCCWKENFYNLAGPSISLENLPSTLRQKVTDIQTHTTEATEGYSLGDLIQVKGKVKIFRDKKEVVANIHTYWRDTLISHNFKDKVRKLAFHELIHEKTRKKVTDPQLQVFRICELPRLYMQQYDRPFQLPLKVHQALNQHRHDSITGGATETSVVLELKSVIFEYISKSSHIVDLPPGDLLQYTKVKDILARLNNGQGGCMEKNQALLFDALSLLEEDGNVTRRNDRRSLFEVLLHKCKLQRTILRILETDTAKLKYSEKGCHYLHILDELHKTLPYAKVKKESLMFCLQKLEAQSDVIRTTYAHYLPCSD